MKLYHRTLGEGEPLIIMHGVFGSSDNWQSVGKVFSERFKVYFLDLRNHGRSPHSEAFDYQSMAEDVHEFIDDMNISKAHLLGHSMGGKVAMQLATDFSDRVNKLVVVDIAPKYYPPHHQQIFDGFRAVDLQSIRSRKEADDQMAEVISSIGVRQFILKNLDREEGGKFKWKLNLKVIEEKANEIGSSIGDQVSFDGKTLFISGSNSDYITKDDHARIRSFFPSSEIREVQGAGHWIHAEKPKDLIRLVMDFLG